MLNIFFLVHDQQEFIKTANCRTLLFLIELFQSGSGDIYFLNFSVLVCYVCFIVLIVYLILKFID